MEIDYEIVPHDGGFAYKLGDVYSETFPSEGAALEAAKEAARRQHIPGETTDIAFQDPTGEWREEHADGHDRPDAEVMPLPMPTTTG